MKLALVCAFVCSSLLMPLHCQAQEPAKPAEESPLLNQSLLPKPRPIQMPRKTNPVKTSPTSLSSGKRNTARIAPCATGKKARVMATWPRTCT